METDKVPLEKGSPEEILKKLGDNFSLDDGVVEALLRLGVESLQEFRFLWASEQAIETWVAKLGLGDKALLMTARVRRAWAAVGLYYRQVEQDRSKIALSDLDTMLGETELRDTKQQFWRRYKMRFPPEIHPADTTISRVAREMQKRMLCVYNIWRVKTLQFQLTTSQKKRKLSEGLFLEDGDDEEVVTHDVDNYLDRLFTLMLAYAMAGCSGGRPEHPTQRKSSTWEQTQSSSSTFPWMSSTSTTFEPSAVWQDCPCHSACSGSSPKMWRNAVNGCPNSVNPR